MKPNDGGSAFPEVTTDYDYNRDGEAFYPNTYSYGGMTLRDYFAAKVMPVALAAANAGKATHEDVCRACALIAYQAADAMLKARDA